MRYVSIIFISAFISFVSGYFYGGSVPAIIHFQRDRVLQEVRDDYFRKCESSSATLRTDGVTEEVWSCPKLKVFLLKRYITTQSELGDKGAE
jgi:hypothetical protein